MASVTSLDSDMRNLRMSRYTSSAANETRTWIEETLGEKLPTGDLLDALKDGVILCKLANLAIGPPGIKYKQSSMPFMQMENISHFLRASEGPPLNLHAHDRFLTVDLYEGKDPAQVLQCLAAFSRAANAANPSRIPTAIGGRRNTTLSPSSTGTTRNAAHSPLRGAASMASMRPASYVRPLSPTKTGGSTTSSNAGPVSSWSSRNDQGSTAPAWNIAQYGYMGGASQGNQGVSFGGRRQITSAGPSVPSLADKQRQRAEKEAEEARSRQEAAEAERRRKAEQAEVEAREKLEEERRWEEETRRAREQERSRLDEQKRQWEEQERKWKLEEEQRQREAEEEKRSRPGGLLSLNGQYLSQYQAEQEKPLQVEQDTPESRRVKELETQLQEAREREKQYQLEREQRAMKDERPAYKRVDSVERPSSAKGSEVSWAPDERESLRHAAPQRALPPAIRKPSGTINLPTKMPELTPEPETETRSLPDPVEYKPKQQVPNRTEQYLSEHTAPVQQRPTMHQPAEMTGSSTLEQQADRDRRLASQQTTKAGGWASKSLLEREMERERERQKEWEAGQAATKAAAKDLGEGSAPGQTWNVNQYGFTGGDNQNKGSSSGSGIAFGGRRQIIGPRPQPQK